MSRYPRKRWALRRRRGAAMVEFCLAIPILAGVIACTWFFGFAMLNQQKVRVAERYGAWAHVRKVPDPVDLNTAFFRGRGFNIDVGADGGPDTNLTAFVDEVAGWTGPGSDLANSLLANDAPRARTATVASEFSSDVAYWQRFTGQIRGSQSREGVEWRRQQLGFSRLLREEYLSDLEAMLSSVPTPGTEMADLIRQLYHNGW